MMEQDRRQASALGPFTRTPRQRHDDSQAAVVHVVCRNAQTPSDHAIAHRWKTAHTGKSRKKHMSVPSVAEGNPSDGPGNAASVVFDSTPCVAGRYRPRCWASFAFAPAPPSRAVPSFQQIGARSMEKWNVPKIVTVNGTTNPATLVCLMGGRVFGGGPMDEPEPLVSHT